MDITAVRKGLANAIYLNVTTPKLNVYWYHPKAFTIPCAYVVPNEIQFDAAMRRGLDIATFTVRVLMNAMDDVASQTLLGTLLNGGAAGSMKAAIQADKTLGGVCDDVHVMSATIQEAQYYEAGQQNYYTGAEFQVRVAASGI